MNQSVFKDKTNNALRISKVSKMDMEIPFKGIGIKFVVSGEETYIANNKSYKLQRNEYILGNDFTSASVQIDQPEASNGICIDISPEIIMEVADYHDVGSQDLKEFLLSDQFLVNRYNVHNTNLGLVLDNIQKKIQANEFKGHS